MFMTSVQDNCLKCNATGASAICSICKEVVYCNDICGAEDWVEHIAECNVVKSDQHIDFLLVPDNIEMNEDAPDFVVQCPNVEGTAMVEYALSEIGLKNENMVDIFQTSTESKKNTAGIKLTPSAAVGDSYGFTIEVRDFNDTDATLLGNINMEGLNLQDDMRTSEKRGFFRSRTGVLNEVVLAPDLKNAKDAMMDIDITKSLTFTFRLFQRKGKGEKTVFEAKGIMLPNTIFSKGDNTVKKGGRRARTFFRSIFTKKEGGSSSASYKSKMKSSLNDVKIAMSFIKDKGRRTATLEDIYFKIPPSLFREGGDNWVLADGSKMVEPVGAPVTNNVIKVDPYELVDVTALCFDLEDRVDALKSLIGDEEEETYKRAHMKDLSRARYYLSVLKGHQAQLQAGIGDEFEPEYKILAAIDAVEKLEPIEAFFSVSVNAEKKKELRRSKESNLRTLINSAKQVIRQGDPVTYEGKFGKIKEFGSKIKRRARGFKKKFKGRLLAFQELIQSRRDQSAPTGVENWPTADDVQTILDLISESLLKTSSN